MGRMSDLDIAIRHGSVYLAAAGPAPEFVFVEMTA